MCKSVYRVCVYSHVMRIMRTKKYELWYVLCMPYDCEVYVTHTPGASLHPPTPLHQSHICCLNLKTPYLPLTLFNLNLCTKCTHNTHIQQQLLTHTDTIIFHMCVYIIDRSTATRHIHRSTSDSLDLHSRLGARRCGFCFLFLFLLFLFPSFQY